MNFVSKRQTELDQAREDENESVLKEYRVNILDPTNLLWFNKGSDHFIFLG